MVKRRELLGQERSELVSIPFVEIVEIEPWQSPLELYTAYVSSLSIHRLDHPYRPEGDAEIFHVYELERRVF